MFVEELVVKANNGGNFFVRAAIHWRSPVGKWPNRLCADKNEHSPEPPTHGGQVHGRWRQGGIKVRWNKEVIGGREGQQVGTGGGLGGGGERKGNGEWQDKTGWRGGGMSLVAASTWARVRHEGARGRTRGLSRTTHFGSKSETKMVRVDSSEQRCQFGSHRCANSFVCLNALGHALSIWVRLLEMP
jgi:hypothetical protein